jgi:hypothetical protein
MRRPHPGEGAKKPEAQYHPDGAAVDATGVWHEGHASYPGRSADLPLVCQRLGQRGVLLAPQGGGMGWQTSAEAIVIARQPGR